MSKNKPGSWKSFKKRFIELQKKISDHLKCHYCGGSLVYDGNSPGEKTVTIDHVVPLSKGGELKDHSNMVICCLSCNNKKGSSVTL